MRRRYLVLPGALLLAALYFSWQGLQAPPSGGRAPAEEPPRYAVTGAEWVRLGRQGQPEFRAEAAAIDYYADDSARLRDIRLDALGGFGSPWRLEAPHGEAPPRERRLRLEGEVHAVGEQEDGVPVTFETTHLWVDLLRRELYTEAPVTVQAGDRNAAARGLRADFAGERVQLLNDVRVDYAPES